MLLEPFQSQIGESSSIPKIVALLDSDSEIVVAMACRAINNISDLGKIPLSSPFN